MLGSILVTIGILLLVSGIILYYSTFNNGLSILQYKTMSAAINARLLSYLILGYATGLLMFGIILIALTLMDFSFHSKEIIAVAIAVLLLGIGVFSIIEFAADPSVTISSSQNPTDVHNSVTFTATPSTGFGSYTYQWYVDGMAISGATSRTYTTSFASAGNQRIFVIIKDSAQTSVQSSTLNETVYSDPSVSISSSQNPTDIGNRVTFTASPSGGTGSYSYIWYLNSNPIRLYSIKINNPTSGTGDYQQMLTLPTSSYGISSTGGNQLFTYFNGTPVYAWIQSINSTSENVWLKLPYGTITLNLTVYADTVNNFNSTGYLGEAPQLSPHFAEYDNGKYVFNNYWNFAGTSLPSGIVSSGNVTQDNGIYVGFGGYVTTSSNYSANPNIIAEFGIKTPTASGGDAWYQIGYVSQSGGAGYEPSVALAWNGNDQTTWLVTQKNTDTYNTTFTPLGSETGNVGIDIIGNVYWTDSLVRASIDGYVDGSNTISISNMSVIPSGNLYLGINNNQHDGTAPPVPTLYYLLTRTYLPLMPSISVTESPTFSTIFNKCGTYSLYVVISDEIGDKATSPTITETVNADATVSPSSSQNPTDIDNSVTFTASDLNGTIWKEFFIRNIILFSSANVVNSCVAKSS